MDNLKTWPERIYLQASDDELPDYADCDGVTWEAEKINACDVAYVRADLVELLKSDLTPPFISDDQLFRMALQIRELAWVDVPYPDLLTSLRVIHAENSPTAVSADALEIWNAALAQVAVYVGDHCVDGEMHAEAILRSERPKIGVALVMRRDACDTIASELDKVTVDKCAYLAKKGMRFVGAVMTDADGGRATIDMGRVTWSDAEPLQELADQAQALDMGYGADMPFHLRQWWITELRKLWAGDELTMESRRAAKVALDFVEYQLKPKAKP